MASVFKRKGDKRWTIAYFDHQGSRREKASGTADKRLAERLAAAHSDKELERERGLVDPVAERLSTERARPLSEHFDGYAEHLNALQRDDRHIDGTMSYLRKVADALEWRTLANIDAHTLTAYLSEQAEKRGTGARTFNAAATAWRAFGKWCVRSSRVAANPLANLGTRNTETDRRRVRRDVSTEELTRIIDAALRSPTVTVTRNIKGSKGTVRSASSKAHCPDRAWAYRIAAGTGFRAGEIASLTPESFDLDGESPSITVEAGYSKRRRRDVQQIRPDLADLLRPWLATKSPRERLRLLPDDRAGQILRADMEQARALWINEAPTPIERAEREASDFLRHTDADGRVVDFHGLRVHYVSRVVETGATVKEAMELARHSDPKLTMKTYARVSIHSLTRVLDKMPKAEIGPGRDAQETRATGTDGRAISPENQCPQKSPHLSRGTEKRSAARRGENATSIEQVDDHKGLELAELRGEVRDDAPQEGKTGVLGFEPRLTESESVVLPLHHTPRYANRIARTRAQRWARVGF